MPDVPTAVGDPLRAPRRSTWWPSVALLTASGVLTALLLGLTWQPVSDEMEPGISRVAGTLLQLDDISGQNIHAPGYALIDQHGDPMTPTEFLGRSVVLTVNDDKCDDLCTLLAQDIVEADRDLGTATADVAFVSVNANPYHSAVSDVKAWSEQHGLGALDNWYFGTGTPAQLADVWKSYGVPVELDEKNKTVGHGAQIFFIDPNGKEIAIGEFGTDAANTAPFAHAMAQMAVDALPKGRRTRVGGPSLPDVTTGGAAKGARPATAELPDLRRPQKTISTDSGLGTYTVMNFWASTCGACTRELPELEQSHRDLGDAVTFLGIDVSDNDSALLFSARAGVTYPLLNDAQGSVSGEYRITGLPYTVIEDSTGMVVVRHAGALSTEQVDYLLESLDPAVQSG